jgi:hypothetical protein
MIFNLMGLRPHYYFTLNFNTTYNALELVTYSHHEPIIEYIDYRSYFQTYYD